ncbi:MAG: outer membrane protein [Pseudomonadota bacterium]|uniref:outer membrane protein n=1 Tax=Blastomonas sp. CCH6-A6 TaxID=1768735 RepID=UPI000824D364|nr:outer membrane beta-barrel protein [Blastomonas sp. CCH6-A6]
MISIVNTECHVPKTFSDLAKIAAWGRLGHVKAGYTDASIEGEYDDGTGEISDEVSFGGVRLGAGGEIDLSSNYAIRLEYRYSDYGNLELFGTDTGIGVSRNQGIITLLGKF